MVAPIVAGALVLLGLIAVTSGVVLVSAYKRDIATAEVEEAISANADSTVNTILNNDDLSDEDKATALKEYFDVLVGSGGGSSDQDLMKYAVFGFLGLAAVSILGK
jgi:hypothetical protein